jgi:hypothetical protein
VAQWGLAVKKLTFAGICRNLQELSAFSGQLSAVGNRSFFLLRGNFFFAPGAPVVRRAIKKVQTAANSARRGFCGGSSCQTPYSLDQRSLSRSGQRAVISGQKSVIRRDIWGVRFCGRGWIGGGRLGAARRQARLGVPKVVRVCLLAMSSGRD